MSKGASQATGLGSAKAPEPHSRLRPSGAIPCAFTPGPWAADSRHAIRISTGKKIATADVWGPSWSDKKANARLIAATPDLYAALKKCVELIEDIHRNHVRCHGPIYHDALDALAKARGEKVQP